MRGNRFQHAHALLRTVEQLDELHRGEDEIEAAPEVERAGIRGHGVELHLPRLRAPRRLLEERRLEVDAGDAVAAAREPDRHPARAAAEVEHVARRLAGQLVPQGQVGGVGAALHVVPDGLGHSQNGGA